MLLMHSSSNDSIIQLGPLGSGAMFEVVGISNACFVHLRLQYVLHKMYSTGFKLANLDATVTTK